MLLIVLRKIFKNKWLVSCLLLGSILASCIMSSIPIYTKAVLERMLNKDLVETQTSTGVYPGKLSFEWTGNISMTSPLYYLDRYNNLINNTYLPKIKLPVKSGSQALSTVYYRAYKDEDLKNQIKKNIRFTLLNDMEQHIKILEGRLPSENTDNNCIEIMVNQAACKNLDFSYNGVYYLSRMGLKGDKDNLAVKVVGIYEISAPDDIYWINNSSSFNDTAFINSKLFNSLFMNQERPLVSTLNWNYALDYNKIQIENIDNIIKTDELIAKEQIEGLKYDFPPAKVLNEYVTRRDTLTYTLWVLQVPVILMIVFYIIMVSNLILDYEKNERAVLKSRGASNLQIFMIYVYQAAALSAISFFAGPLLGQIICSVIGSTNGFMQFVNRTGLKTELTPQVFMYSAAAVLVFSLALLLPVVFSSDISIVEFKRRKSNKKKKVFWQKFYLDLILLGFSFYGLFLFKNRSKIVNAANLESKSIPIDPVLFVVSVAFILGAGLLLLRVYPLVIKAVYFIGKKLWTPVVYTALLSATQISAREYFIMIFLILTTSMGIYNSVSARTLNQNYEDRIYYNNGADIVLSEKWAELNVDDKEEDGGETFFLEPQFSRFTKMDGVESAAKVYVNNNVTATKGEKYLQNITVMGIDPVEFAKTAWYRKNLMNYHINEYMNIMFKNRNAVIVSTSLLEKTKLNVGDTFTMNWGENKSQLECIIYAAVDYFPSYNRFKSELNVKNAQTDLIIANLEYINSEMKLEPYNVWLKLNKGASTQHIYDQLTALNVQLKKIESSPVQVIAKKNDPMLQGTNGSLTLSFIITILVTLIGYVIYWLISIKNRLLQFGILRSMGLTKNKLVLLLICEQFLISLIPMAMGIGVGTVAAKLFVPLLEMNTSAADKVPPFISVMLASDYLFLGAVFGIIVIFGIAVLSVIVTRVNVNQVLKLGED